MTKTMGDKLVIGARVLLAVLVCAGVVMALLLLKRVKPVTPGEQEKAAEKSRVIARKELQAFTLLTENHLEAREGTVDALEGPPPTIEELQGRYLLVKVGRRKEITREMVAPAGATPSITKALAGAVAVAIPATASNSLGGSLQTGDFIDLLVATDAGNSRPPGAPVVGVMKFENLLVLNVPPRSEALKADKEAPPGAVTLALSAERLNEFALALAGGTLVISRHLNAAR